MRGFFCLLALLAAAALSAAVSSAASAGELRGEIVDAASGEPLAARVYLQSAEGAWHFARSAPPEGSAVEYNKARGASVEKHTCLSAHPFAADLPPGRYTLTVERGKEYLPHVEPFELGAEPLSVRVRLRRFANLAALGWYSGETHVHRTLAELPTAMLADDLNVALPLTYWVTAADTPPSRGDKNSPAVRPELIRVDATHVIYPMNTEYEIFTVGGKSHTLGAVFALGHKTVFERGAPPVREIAAQTRREGGLLELDKHNWPWSMMLVPVMNVDLYELTNNHLWRTEFFFKQFGEPPADYMRVERTAEGFTEKGWLEFTLANYYTLLNCGFRLRPTAGTASGVHPVPLGFGRVYVRLPGGFTYEAWMKGLAAGESFVSTGPLLAHETDRGKEAGAVRLSGTIWSARPISLIEVVSAGEVARALRPESVELPTGGYETRYSERLASAESTWHAVRCFEPQADGRLRFAHSAPVFIEIEGKPLRPRAVEVEYLIRRVETELARHAGVLPEAALDEYREALARYRELARTAR